MNAPTQIAYLQHVRDALLSVKEYTAAGREGFFASRMVQDAVVRNLEVVGEAVKALAPETRDRGPEIPGVASLACGTSSFITTSEWISR